MATLLFEDNFDGTTIDTSKWLVWNNNCGWWPATGGWHDNASISNSQLHLMLSVNQDPNCTKPYSGTGLDNQVASSGSKLATGYWECSARAPQSNSGIVPYILLWPNPEQWPPEIDFFEESGQDSNSVFFTQHWGSTNQTLGYKLTIDPTQFHTYGVEITPDSSKLNWYVDGKLITSQTYQSTGQTWKFSLGIWAGNCGGGWGGCPTNTALPQYLDLAYVRIWDSKPTMAPLSVSLTISPAIINLGQSTTMTATVTGGVSPYNYSWSGLSTGCIGGNTNKITCTPTSVGTFNISVSVTDSSA